MSTNAQKIKEEARLRTLRLIVANPNISQRALARELGLSLGATHYMLKALIESGLVKLGRFSAATDKRGYAYILTPDGAAEKAAITLRFLKRKRSEFAALQAEIAEMTAELEEVGLHDGAAYSIKNE